MMGWTSSRPNRQQQRVILCHLDDCNGSYPEGEGVGWDGLYCSTDCSDLDLALKCGYEPCGKNYPPRVGDGMFCSPECTEKYSYSIALPFFREQYMERAA